MPFNLPGEREYGTYTELVPAAFWDAWIMDASLWCRTTWSLFLRLRLGLMPPLDVEVW